MIPILNKYNDLVIKIYITVMPVVSVFINEISSLLFVPIGLILQIVMNEETIKMFSSLFGACGAFLIFLGGFWYVRKNMLESKKAKFESEKALSELEIKKLELEEKKLDNKIKEKDLELFNIVRMKMEAEEENGILELKVKNKELRDKLDETDK